MLKGRPSDLTAKDVERLVDEQVQEGDQCEFKGRLPSKNCLRYVASLLGLSATAARFATDKMRNGDFLTAVSWKRRRIMRGDEPSFHSIGVALSLTVDRLGGPPDPQLLTITHDGCDAFL